MQHFVNKHPEFKTVFHEYPFPKNLLSKKRINLSSENFGQCVDIINAFWALRENEEYRKFVYDHSLSQAVHNPTNYSMLMCFDFHITPKGPKLIEINTNAAFGIIAWYLSETEGCNVQNIGFDRLLQNTIHKESNHLGLKLLDIAIIDEAPQKQATFFEFQYFKILFESWGHKVIICDTKDLIFKHNQLTTKEGKNINFVYNRCCDFLFEKPEHLHLKDAFLSKAVCFSPNPHEYNLLANKQRFIDLSNAEFLAKLNIDKRYKNIIKNTVPKSFNITDFDIEELKLIKSKYVFKPKTSYGSKAVYIGKSISQTKLSSVYDDMFMVQEYIPPSKLDDYKYDLRIYVYKNEIHLMAARLYKGQVTNASSDGGGFASVTVKD